MDFETARNYCLNQIGAKEIFIFKDKIQTFTIGNKQFCRVYNVEGQKAFLMKSYLELNQVLRQMYSGILLPTNLDNNLWNLVLIDSDVPDEEIYFLIDQSYKMMFKALTKKVQGEILEKNRLNE